jgi:hypothetical protein
MKNIFYILLSILAFSSCEEVIDVNLDTAAPRLVIDASIKWDKETDGKTQFIKLSTTTGYFDTIIPTVSGATVTVANSKHTIFTFIELDVPGEYTCLDFIPEINETYTLTVILNGQTYTATETLKPVPPIEKIEQEKKDGFTGKFIQVKAFYTDNGATNDYYLFRFKPNFKVVPSYQVSEDRFYQGNQIFGLYLSEDFKTGDNVDITIYGISQRYFNYMSKLITVSGSGGPFQAPPATVYGNIINISDKDNYALGFFSLSEVDYVNYMIQ